MGEEVTESAARQKKINVPTQYKEGSKMLRQMAEEGKSLKNLLYNNKHIRVNSMVKLLNTILSREQQLEEIIKKTGIFEKEKHLNPWLGRILIAELLFGRMELNGESKPVQCVRGYKTELEQALAGAEHKPKEHKESKYKVPRFVRINTMMIDRKEALEYCESEGWHQITTEFTEYNDFLEAVRNLTDEEFIEDFHVPAMLVFPHTSKKWWSANPLRHEGKFLLQDKASCLPSFMLAPPKKSTVLDMCAAPGMKTLHLAAIMKNKGKIYAVERDPERFKLLSETVASSGAKIIQPINADVTSITEEKVQGVEYILLDPSCSGSGMLNRFVEDDEKKDTDRLYKLAGLQYKLLYYAMTAFPKVQKIVYSTCSLHPEENEEVVLGVLRHCKDFKLINATELLGGYWKHTGDSGKYPGVGENCIYAKTEVDLTIGFFVAVMVRCDEGEVNEFFAEKQSRKRQFEKNQQNEGKSKDNKYKKMKRQKEEGDN